MMHRWRVGLVLVFGGVGLAASGAHAVSWKKLRNALSMLPGGSTWSHERRLFKQVDKVLGSNKQVESLSFFPRSHRQQDESSRNPKKGLDEGPMVQLFRTGDISFRAEKHGETLLFVFSQKSNAGTEAALVIWDGEKHKWLRPNQNDIAIGRRLDDVINKEEDLALKMVTEKGGPLPLKWIPRGSLFLDHLVGIP